MRQCNKIQAWVSASLDGETQGRWAHVVERHLAECPHCRVFKEHLVRLKEALRRQTEVQESVPFGLWDEVERRLEQVAAPRAHPWVRRGLVPALGVAAVILALVGLGTFRRGAVLSPEALAAEFPKQGGLLPLPARAGDTQAMSEMSRVVGFAVSPPDLSGCGFVLVRAALTEVGGLRGVSFVYRRGREVAVISQLPAVPRLEGFAPTTGRGEQRIHQATVRDLKLVVWREGNRLSGLCCSQQVFTGPLGQMRCR